MNNPDYIKRRNEILNTFVNHELQVVGGVYINDDPKLSYPEAQQAIDDLVLSMAEKVTRFEVIDHRECVWCRGRKTANYLQKDGSYKEQPCDKCDGSGIMGGRVYAANSNPETSNIKIELSYQDDGRTLKVFVNDVLGTQEGK